MNNNFFQSEIWEKFQTPNATRINGKLFIKHPLPFHLYWLECPMAEVKKEDVDAIACTNLIGSAHPATRSSYAAHIATHSASAIPATRTAPTTHSSYAAQASPVFIRFNPGLEKNQPYTPPKNSQKTKNSHFPQATIIIDLSQPENEILAQMKQKGRYNIKIAQKNNISVHEYNSTQIDQTKNSNSSVNDPLNAFYELLQKTATRDRFHIHPKNHYEKMLKSLGPDHAKLFVAKLNNQIVAAAIVTFHGDTAIYYYGASDHDLRHLMAPYLLHFEIMRHAAAHGYKKYDLFGIAPAENFLNQKIHQTLNKKHPWSGVTEFKKKFGGKYIEYHESREIVLRPVWYWLYKAAKIFL